MALCSAARAPTGSSPAPVGSVVTPKRVPLGVLDLVPISSGSDPPAAVRNSIDLARAADALGYVRYWFAEHHLDPGVAGSSPVVLIGTAAAATTNIRVGSGRRPERAPDRALHRRGVRSPRRPLPRAHRPRHQAFAPRRPPRTARASETRSGERIAGGKTEAPGSVPDGRRAAHPGPAARPGAARLAPRHPRPPTWSGREGAEPAGYGDLIEDVVGLLAGTWRSTGGLPARPVPGTGADLDLWVIGSGEEESAAVAGRLGVRFAANYHASPATVLEVIDAYRDAFVPSAGLDHPYVAVSANAVVGSDDGHANQLAEGYPLWVLSVRSGQGAMPFPSPEEARRHHWTEEERVLVLDRAETQFVGSPSSVVSQLGLVAGGYRGRRADRDHRHPPARGSGPLLPPAGRGVDGWATPVAGLRIGCTTRRRARPGPARHRPPGAPAEPARPGQSAAMAASTSSLAARRAGQVAAPSPSSAARTRNTTRLAMGMTMSVMPCCFSEAAKAVPEGGARRRRR